MTLDRRQMAILAGHAQSILNIVGPAPGEETPPPPPPQPGPGTPPTVTTLAASATTATTATLNGNLLSLGNVDSETPRTTVDVFFQWRVVGAGTWTETTPVAQVAVGAFSAGLTGLTPDTAHEARAAVTSEAGTVYGAVLGFTSDEVTIPDPPADNFLDLTASAVQSFDATVAGDLSGPAGTWADSAGGFRQLTPPSMIVGDLILSLGMRSSWKTISSAAWMNASEFTWVIVGQQHGSTVAWQNVLSRDEGSQAGGYALGIPADGRVTWRPRPTAGVAALLVDTPAGQVVPGDIFVIFCGVGPSGAFVRVGMNAEVVNGTLTSMPVSSTSSLTVGAYRSIGQAPFYGGLATARLLGARLTTGQMDAIVAQVKARIQFAPPIVHTSLISEVLDYSIRDRALMASGTPTAEVTVQPSNAVAAISEDGTRLEISPTAVGISTNGRYTLTDSNGTSPAAAISVTVTQEEETPAELTATRVGVGTSGAIVEGLSATATWADSFVPAAGDLIIAWAVDMAGVVQPATSTGYALLLANEQAMQLANFRQRGDLLWKIAGGSEPATVDFTYVSASAAHILMAAYRLSAGWAFDGVAVGAGNNTGSQTGKAAVSLDIPAGPHLVLGMWSGRHTQGTPEPVNMQLDVGDDPVTFSVNSADGVRRLRGATDGRVLSGVQAITNAVRHE